MNIIGIAGRMGAGKDTVADMLVAKHGYVKVALADPIKRIAKDLWGFTDEVLWGPSAMRETALEEWKGAHDIDVETRDYVFCKRCGATGVPIDVPPCKLTARYALQRLGTEVGRSIDPDVWINKTIDVARTLLEDPAPVYWRETGLDFEFKIKPYRGVVVSDVRFPNEARRIVEAGGRVWLIDRPARCVRCGAVYTDYGKCPADGCQGGRGESPTHASEKLDIDPSLVATTIVNDGTLEALAAKVEEALR